MGLDQEYSVRRFCETEACERDAQWAVNVHWSLTDFLGVDVCGDHLPYTIEYWRRFTVDGVEPEIWADQVLPW